MVSLWMFSKPGSGTNDSPGNTRTQCCIVSMLPASCYSSRKRLSTKVIPDLHLTYSKNGGGGGGEILGWNKTIKSGNFSIKLNVVRWRL